ncbi:hypothetical protein M1N79_03855 [Dehalococcoidia bacterium]|nr:hypothetical protein [Dehalococcoidia bacterium]
MKKFFALLVALILAFPLVFAGATEAQGTTVEVNEGKTITIAPGGTLTTIPLDIRGIPDLGPDNGVGGFTFELSWDPTVIHVDDVVEKAISGFPIVAGDPDNVEGSVKITGFMFGTLLTGDVTVATLDISAQGAAGTSTSIDVTIIDLGDKDGITIAASPVSAPVKIVGVVPPPQYTLTITIDPPEGGRVSLSPEPIDGKYAAQTEVTLTAEPEEGWRFERWSGDVTGTEPVATLTMDADKSVTAHFAPIKYTLTVTIEPPNSGAVSLSPEPIDGKYAAQTEVTLTAKPEEGWRFERWSGDVTGTKPVVRLIMDADKSVTAHFTVVVPPFDFSLAVDPTAATITQGEEVTATVTATLEAGITEEVTLTYTLPEGVEGITVTFDPEAGTPEFASDMTITTTADATLGEHEITITGTSYPGEVVETVTFTLTVVAPPPPHFTHTLPAGWNLLSTPIKLDADSDALGQIFDAESLANINVFYTWDAQLQRWVQLLGVYELSPLYAIYVKVEAEASATATFILSQELSAPPARWLEEGVNLIGPAPALEAGVFPAMPLNLALVSIEEAPGGLRGYTMVISPGLNQPGWVFALGGEVKDLLPFKGYWVVMENADTLYGFSTTPISP